MGLGYITHNGSPSTSGDGSVGYWSSTAAPGDNHKAYKRLLEYNNAKINYESDDMHIGYSVRCLKD